MKLGLGTAQLGLIYGIANKTGKPDDDTAFQILLAAYKSGMDFFDTAQGYGNSENLIGEFLSKYGLTRKIKICTKAKTFIGSKNLREDVNASVRHSLDTLKLDKISYFLLHSPRDVHELGSELIRCFDKHSGSIEKFGVSVYTPDEIRECLNYPEIKAIQLPYNLLDNRLDKSGILRELKQRGIDIIARSIYLQGLLLLEDIPERLSAARPYVSEIAQLAASEHLTPKELAFLHVRDNDFIDVMIVGCETLNQVYENVRLFNKKEIVRVVLDREVPEKILNPSMW